MYNVIMKLNSLISQLLKIEEVYAHCDVPCGIYDPKPAQIAAETVLKMTQKILELAPAGDEDLKAKLEYQNSLTRMIWTKEEHARKCKEEILILWTDYFKKEHLTTFPELHDLFWQTAKLCSKTKQNVDLEAAESLVDSVNKIADIFNQSKK